MKIQLRQGENWFEVEADEIKIEGVTAAKKETFTVTAKYEKGKWYLEEDEERLFLFNGEYDKEVNPMGYGFDLDGETFYEVGDVGWESNEIEATKEQVEDAFRKYFKKLGFEKGVKFICLLSSAWKSVFKEDELYFIPNMEGVSSCDGLIFHNGKFATPIKD